MVTVCGTYDHVVVVLWYNLAVFEHMNGQKCTRKTNVASFSLSVKGKSIEKNWRPEVAIWRLNFSVRSLPGTDAKKLISDPAVELSSLFETVSWRLANSKHI